MTIYNAEIHTMEGGAPFFGYVSFENGIITDIGCGEPPKIRKNDLDAENKKLFPGFIDAHSHIGLIGDGMGAEGEDVNEDTDPVTPHLRTIDGINCFDRCFSDAVECGVTCAVTGVGSSNPIGGDFIAVKTYGRTADEMLIKKIGIKFALGENPKSTFSDKDSAPVTRMATAAIIREALFRAKRYLYDKNEAMENGESLPEFDMKSEALIPLLEHKLSAHFHCHRADDIMTAVRIAKEFDLDYVLIHCTEGHRIADILGKEKVRAVVGPVICDRGKPELSELTTANAGVLFDNGVKTAICTDHPEIPVQYLFASAAYCVKSGLPREEALKSITINAAEIAGIADRTGSIKVGKDADFALFDGDPLEIMTKCTAVFINGQRRK